MNPITSATVSGVGQTPLGVVEGTWVVGFFQDGADAQQPIIIGTLPGVPSELSREGKNNEHIKSEGFWDPLGNYPRYINEPDVNRLAVNNEENPHPSLTLRKADRAENIGTANVDATTIVDDVLSTGGTLRAVIEARPFILLTMLLRQRVAIYESMMTPHATRIHERHASGTGYEIFDDGTKVTRIKKDNYEITTGNDYAYIQGTSKHTVDGGLRVKINNRPLAAAPGQVSVGNHYNIEVGANANCTVEVVSGDINLISQQGDVNLKAGKNMNIDVAQALNIKVGGKITETSKNKTESAQATDREVTGTNTKTGKTINLN